MGKIDLGRVFVGGLLAGVVLNIVDFVLYGVLLRQDMAAALQALGKPPMPDSLIWLYVAWDFVLGVTLIWLYAAIRPRFGPGPRTAVIAGLCVWFLIGLMHAIGEAPMGLFPQKLYTLGTVVALVQIPVAAVVGAAVYKEM